MAHRSHWAGVPPSYQPWPSHIGRIGPGFRRPTSPGRPTSVALGRGSGRRGTGAGAGPAGAGGSLRGGNAAGPGLRRPGGVAGGVGPGRPAHAVAPVVTESKHRNPYSGKIGSLITCLFRNVLTAIYAIYRNPRSGAARMAGTGRSRVVCGGQAAGPEGGGRGGRPGLPGAAAGPAGRGPRRAAAGSAEAPRRSWEPRRQGRSPRVRPAATVRYAHHAARRRRPGPAAVTAGDLPRRRRAPGGPGEPATGLRSPRVSLDAMSKCRQSTGSFFSRAAITA